MHAFAAFRILNAFQTFLPFVLGEDYYKLATIGGLECVRGPGVPMFEKASLMCSLELQKQDYVLYWMAFKQPASAMLGS